VLVFTIGAGCIFGMIGLDSRRPDRRRRLFTSRATLLERALHASIDAARRSGRCGDAAEAPTRA
jgi:hypothetical protein